MTPRSLYGLVRWGLCIGLLVMAYFYLDHAIGALWQTAPSPEYEQTQTRAYEAYNALGRTIALIVCALIAFINVRPGWPFLRSRWNLLLTGVALAAFFIPPATQYWAIDACLDSGGMWDHENGICTSGV